MVRLKQPLFIVNSLHTHKKNSVLDRFTPLAVVKRFVERSLRSWVMLKNDIPCYPRFEHLMMRLPTWQCAWVTAYFFARVKTLLAKNDYLNQQRETTDIQPALS